MAIPESVGRVRIEFAVLELGKKREGKPGVAGELDEPHFAAQAQLFDVVSETIAIKRGLHMWRDHGDHLAQTEKETGSFSKGE